MLERSIYVLLASIVPMILFVGWRPLPTVLWSVTSPLGAGALWAMFAAGWGIGRRST